MDGIRTKKKVRFDPRTVGRGNFWRMAEAAQAVTPLGYYLTITSGCDGRHKSDSRHYLGWAIDLRVKDLPGVEFEKRKTGKNTFWVCIKGRSVVDRWTSRIAKRLGDQYFVDFEESKVHIHIQYNGGGK